LLDEILNVQEHRDRGQDEHNNAWNQSESIRETSTTEPKGDHQK